VPLPAGVPAHAVVTVLFLHGFLSSARSSKAAWLRERLEPLGVTCRCLDFNEPDFHTMTMTRMLGQLEDALRAARGAALVGSSLGGALAILAAARVPSLVGRLVLLAPAVRFGDPERHVLTPDQIAIWKRRGEYDFFHYAHEQQRSLAYAFYEDSLQYDTFGTLFAQPTVIFQGTRDTLVDPEDVRQFAAARPNVTLSLVDDEHQLISSLPQIWSGVQPFLEVR
jgi:pimeloyl-ACP methyl ester carboxylesterase